MIVLAGVVCAAVVALGSWRISDRRRPGRRRALLIVAAVVGVQALIGLPAAADPTDCTPNPERPGSGLVGVLDSTPRGHGQPGSPYADVGYAGLVWHVYAPNCGGITVLTNSGANIDTWVGSQLFDTAKIIVGATNGLHYVLLDGTLSAPLDSLVAVGSSALYHGTFTPYLSVCALIAVVLLFPKVWAGNLASIGRRAAWALAGLWLASSTFFTPFVYTQVLDGILMVGANDMQVGYVDQTTQQQRDALPTLLHQTVVYDGWLRGEFDSPDAPQAQQYGPKLLDAQAYTKTEIAKGADSNQDVVDAKKRRYIDIRSRLGNATGSFDGTDTGRIGAGFLALLHAVAFGLFLLLAKVAVLLAQVVLRVIVLAGPLLGLAGWVYPPYLRKTFVVGGTALFSALMLSALAGVDTVVVTWLCNAGNHIAELPRVLLASAVSGALLVVGWPIFRAGVLTGVAATGRKLNHQREDKLTHRGVARAKESGVGNKKENEDNDAHPEAATPSRPEGQCAAEQTSITANNSGNNPHDPPSVTVVASQPISMDIAIELAIAHAGDNAKPGKSGSKAVQFVSSEVGPNGEKITRIARLDVNPTVSHVQKLGPHLNLETQINGRTVREGPLKDPHIPIDPSTIRPGDYY